MGGGADGREICVSMGRSEVSRWGLGKTETDSHSTQQAPRLVPSTLVRRAHEPQTVTRYIQLAAVVSDLESAKLMVVACFVSI